jgi:hypothetical protein
MIPCDERNHREKEHAQAGAEFDVSRKNLQARIGISSKEEFLSLSRKIDQSWAALVRARIALDQHIREHGCR